MYQYNSTTVSAPLQAYPGTRYAYAYAYPSYQSLPAYNRATTGFYVGMHTGYAYLPLQEPRYPVPVPGYAYRYPGMHTWVPGYLPGMHALVIVVQQLHEAVGT